MPKSKTSKFPKPKPLTFDENFKENWDTFLISFNNYYSDHDHFLQNNIILEKLIEYISIPELLDAIKTHKIDISTYRTVKSVQTIIKTLITFDSNCDEKHIKNVLIGQNKFFTTFQEQTERIDSFFSRINAWIFWSHFSVDDIETLKWEQLVFGVNDDEKRQIILEERMDYWKIFALFRKEETLNMPMKKKRICKAIKLEESVKMKLTEGEMQECNQQICPECEQVLSDVTRAKCRVCVNFCSHCGEVGHQMSGCATKKKGW